MGRTLRELRSAQTQLGAYLQAASDLQSRVDELVASRSMAQTLQNNQKQLLNINTEIDRVSAQQQTVADTLGKVSGRFTFDSAAELFTDLRLHLDQATEQFQNWRKAKVVFDLNKALNNFAADEAQGVTEAQALAQIGAAEQEYAVALGLAQELAPAASSLLELAR